MIELRGRKISNGRADGKAIVSAQPVSFYGGVDPDTGIVIEKGHPMEGVCIKDSILVFPNGKGSTVGSYTLYRLKKNGLAPKAIVNKECETIIAVGTIISGIPCIDKVGIEKINNGAIVEVDADNGIVKVY